MATLRAIVLLSALAATAALAAERAARFPATLSKLDGWRGVRVVRGAAAGCPTCCRIVFPPRFGAANAAELDALRGLVSNPEAADDVSCGATEARREALAQIRRLAVEHQDRGAALLLVSADTEGGMDLGGGNLSEQHAAADLVPVLETYPHVQRLVGPALEPAVAGAICRASEFPQMNVPALVARLRAKGARSLAATIARTCGLPAGRAAR